MDDLTTWAALVIRRVSRVFLWLFFESSFPARIKIKRHSDESTAIGNFTAPAGNQEKENTRTGTRRPAARDRRQPIKRITWRWAAGSGERGRGPGSAPLRLASFSRRRPPTRRRRPCCLWRCPASWRRVRKGRPVADRSAPRRWPVPNGHDRRANRRRAA